MRLNRVFSEGWIGIRFEQCHHLKWYKLSEVTCKECTKEQNRMLEKLNKFLGEP